MPPIGRGLPGSGESAPSASVRRLSEPMVSGRNPRSPSVRWSAAAGGRGRGVYPSGQRGRAVNPLAFAFVGSNPTAPNNWRSLLPSFSGLPTSSISLPIGTTGVPVLPSSQQVMGDGSPTASPSFFLWEVPIVPRAPLDACARWDALR